MKTVAPPIGEPSAPSTRPERSVLASATFAKSATASAAEDHALRQLVIPPMIPPARTHFAAYHPPTSAAMGATNSPRGGGATSDRTQSRSLRDAWFGGVNHCLVDSPTAEAARPFSTSPQAPSRMMPELIGEGGREDHEPVWRDV